MSCKKNIENEIGVIWSDNVEFAWYCELFNASQQKWKFVVEYKKNIIDELLTSHDEPDIIVCSFLNVHATQGRFRKLDHLIAKMGKHFFYDELLELGKTDGTQYLLPVSFNLPTIIFSINNTHLLQNPFTLSFDDLKKLSPSFNTKSRGLYTRMGFAPRWEDEVLYLAMQGMGVNFEETIFSPSHTATSSPKITESENKEYTFQWDEDRLEKTISYLKNWTASTNENSEQEEDFKFKYLYNVPYLLIENSLCAFYYMPTDRLFSIEPDKMRNLDFRYLEMNGKIPCKDDVLYIAIPNICQNIKASEAFLQWFYSSETQEELLIKKMESSLLAKKFGIAGGFSASKQVTCEVFPKYYPLLLSHLLPNDSLKVPSILPKNWSMLKEKILIPYLQEASRVRSKEENSFHQMHSLTQRVNEWMEKRIIR